MAKYKAYPEYKDSGVEWLGMVPSHWNIKRLGQFFEERRDKVSDKDYPPLSVTMQGIVPQIDTAAKTDAGDNRKLVLKNDFVINSRSDRKGSSGMSQLNGSVSLISIVMEPKRIDPKFAHHLLRSYPFQEEFYRYGKGIVADLWSTNSSEMKNILIPELADDESNAIACFLDHETAKIDNLIEKQQQLIELLKEKRQAVISHAVTKGLNPDVPMKDSGVEWLGEVPEHWTVCRLKQIIKSGTSISYGIVQPGDSLDEGVPFIQTTNISQGNIQLESLPKTSKIIEKNYPRSRLDGGEVILGIRASIGSAYVVPLELKGANLSRGVARIQPGTNISADYLVWYLKTNAVEQYWALSKQGSTFSEVSIETVRELTVCVPPKDEQYNIASRLEGALDRIHKLIVKSEIKMNLLRERRTALISAAVTGKIDVRDWVAPDTQNVEEPQEASA
ncbi:restriction endonuclease subunit S [Klebsiella aerogenes]